MEPPCRPLSNYRECAYVVVTVQRFSDCSSFKYCCLARSEPSHPVDTMESLLYSHGIEASTAYGAAVLAP